MKLRMKRLKISSSMYSWAWCDLYSVCFVCSIHVNSFDDPYPTSCRILFFCRCARRKMKRMCYEIAWRDPGVYRGVQIIPNMQKQRNIQWFMQNDSCFMVLLLFYPIWRAISTNNWWTFPADSISARKKQKEARVWQNHLHLPARICHGVLPLHYCRVTRDARGCYATPRYREGAARMRFQHFWKWTLGPQMLHGA